MTLVSTKPAGTLTTIFPVVIGASLGKENCQSREERESSQWRQSRSGHSGSRDPHLCRKGLCRSITSRSGRCSWPNEGKSLPLHLFQGITSLSHVSGSARTSKHNYCYCRWSEVRSGEPVARIRTQSGDFLRGQSGTSKHLFPRTSTLNWKRSRDSKGSAARFSCVCSLSNRGCLQSRTNAPRLGYSDRNILFTNCSKWNSYLLTSSRWREGRTNCGRNIGPSLCRDSHARLTKGKIDLANSEKIGLANLANSNQLTGVTE